MSERSVVTIGNFDGVHAGHAALVAEARLHASQSDARVVVLSFDPHPISVLRPERTPERLTTFEQRRGLLLSLGADEVRRLEPTPELLAQSPREFIERVVREHRPAALVEGPDFHFGHKRAGTVQTLGELGSRLSEPFAVHVVEPVAAVLGNQQIVTASSTRVRSLLTQGRVADAWAVLGRPYALSGVVERGDRRGRSVGVPTANLRCRTLLPADGVYAALGELPDGRTWPAAVNVGSRPTVGGVERRVEAHLIGAGHAVGAGDGWSTIDGLDEYGWALTLHLVGWVRDQIRFADFDALVSQIRRDTVRAAAIVRRRFRAA